MKVFHNYNIDSVKVASPKNKNKIKAGQTNKQSFTNDLVLKLISKN